jgi:hypothetical protein
MSVMREEQSNVACTRGAVGTFGQGSTGELVARAGVCLSCCNSLCVCVFAEIIRIPCEGGLLLDVWCAGVCVAC